MPLFDFIAVEGEPPSRAELCIPLFALGTILVPFVIFALVSEVRGDKTNRAAPSSHSAMWA